ncbi:MAG TPA: MFS transporter [Cyclobacteriaceae bacterium]|nr:MFS transporter [Cyclobacteriaceae bacterium]
MTAAVPIKTRYRYTTQFWMLCGSSLLFFASFNMLIPELPSYLTGLHGGEYKGLIISLFTVTAMISRPFSGKLADNIGRKPVIILGGAVCMICSLLYPVLTSLFGFFLLRFVHGFSTGFTPTGQSAYVSDLIPADRRGEAMGWLGTIGSVGMAFGPAIGGWVTREYGINTMFYLSSAFGFMAAAIVIRMKETLQTRKSFRFSMLKVGKEDLFEPRVLLPCIVMGLAFYAYGVFLTLIPDFGEQAGIQKKELLFTVFTISTLLIRLVAGRASDKYGRVPVLVISTGLIMIAMMTISVATTPGLLIAGVFLYGLAQGGVSPTLLAWVTDLSETAHRGRAIASLYIFMELGIGVGAYMSGWLFGQTAPDFFTPFIVGSIMGGVAFIILLVKPLLQRA